MPGTARRRRPDRLSEHRELTFDLLWHRVEIRADTDEAAAACEPLRHGARQPVAPVTTTRLEIRQQADGYRVLDRGDQLAEPATAHDAGVVVFERVQRRVFELAALKGWLRVHGAVLEVAGRRVAVIGPSGSGKTTLALAALAAGQTAEADESFLTDGNRVLAVPRRFHCEAGTLDLVPEARAWVASAPVLSTDPPIWAIDPAALVDDWAVRSAPVDAIVVLTGHDEKATLRPLATPEALPHLLTQALPTVESRSAVMARLAPLVSGTPLVALGGGHTLTPAQRLSLLDGIGMR